MKLRVNEWNITWPGRLKSKPEGLMIPTHLKVLTIEEKPFVYVREASEIDCLPDEIACPHFNVTDHESKQFNQTVCIVCIRARVFSFKIN